MDQEARSNNYETAALEEVGDFVSAVKTTQSDTISTRITSTTGYLAGIVGLFMPSLNTSIYSRHEKFLEREDGDQ